MKINLSSKILSIKIDNKSHTYISRAFPHNVRSINSAIALKQAINRALRTSVTLASVSISVCMHFYESITSKWSVIPICMCVCPSEWKIEWVFDERSRSHAPFRLLGKCHFENKFWRKKKQTNKQKSITVWRERIIINEYGNIDSRYHFMLDNL